MMCNLDWVLLLEYMKVILSAPPVAGAVVITIILILKAEIKQLIFRAREIYGVKLDAPTQIPEPASKYSYKLLKFSRRTATDFIPDVAPTSKSNEIEIDRSRMPESLANDPIAEDEIKLAIKDPYQYVAGYKRAMLSLNSEKLFTNIFGSQIRLLDLLAKTNGELDENELVVFYQAYKEQVPRTNYSYSDYLQFLVQSELVSVNENRYPKAYAINQNGIDFLSYIKTEYEDRWHSKPF